MSRFTRDCNDGARGDWRPRSAPEDARRLRLFVDAVPEWAIFHGHPAAPFVLAAPVIGLLLEHAARAPVAAAPACAWFALGALGWTLLEYAMHRWAFHYPARGTLARVLTFVVHGHHHVRPREPSRLAATPVQMASMGALAAGVWRLALGSPLWMLATAGTLTAYLAYEAVHHLAHHGRPRSGWLRAVTQHHLAHHYRRPDACFGISSPLWDWVFGTR